jgi:uncharacterized protein (DUF1778 family)
VASFRRRQPGVVAAARPHGSDAAFAGVSDLDHPLTSAMGDHIVRTLSVHRNDVMTLARGSRRKEDRLELRLEPANRRLLDEAAAASAMSTSAFVLSHATEAAREVLADRTTFVLPDERWDAFVKLLEREQRPMPGLAAFLARPSVLREE